MITLRPLVRIFGSQWQQYMQNRMVISYETWLDAMLNKPEDGTVTPSFWKRHRHDRLVQRWADAVGADNLTVIVVDESDRRMLVRTFEELLGLTDGTLEPRDPGANRSLTYAEAELLRAFNRSFLDHGWSHADYTRLVRFGAARHLQQRRPGPDEPRVLTPAWAVERGSEIGAEMVRHQGHRGPGDRLPRPAGRPGAAPAVGDNPGEVEIPFEIAARFAAGLVNHLADIPGRQAPPSGWSGRSRRSSGPVTSGTGPSGRRTTPARAPRSTRRAGPTWPGSSDAGSATGSAPGCAGADRQKPNCR